LFKACWRAPPPSAPGAEDAIRAVRPLPLPLLQRLGRRLWFTVADPFSGWCPFRHLVAPFPYGNGHVTSVIAFLFGPGTGPLFLQPHPNIRTPFCFCFGFRPYFRSSFLSFLFFSNGTRVSRPLLIHEPALTRSVRLFAFDAMRSQHLR